MGCIDSEAVGICLDTVNSFGAGECIQNIINMLGPLTVNLHIKDFTIKRAPHGMGFNVEGCPVGTGMLDIPKLLEKFSMSQRNINAIIEMWTPPGDTLAETIAKEENWVVESVKII